MTVCGRCRDRERTSYYRPAGLIIRNLIPCLTPTRPSKGNHNQKPKQFNGQEPGCDVDIKEFAKKNGVKYDMYSKIDVNGDEADPLYKWLKKQQGGILGIHLFFLSFVFEKLILIE